eukprot:CAMPEP_0196757710 /NCGR_PEP_ID=MMETSP1091-20130531/103806_1 /TAXON_ID=302021 /ORGANISM="Rhodomonas sp., Strain CCMP768" /LENGTH=93 /DNA_ID=CAMNT_0042106497 /DNA_START=794 /DNA_END=1072 /DNA_ORIENTATION=-
MLLYWLSRARAARLRSGLTFRRAWAVGEPSPRMADDSAAAAPSNVDVASMPLLSRSLWMELAGDIPRTGEAAGLHRSLIASKSTRPDESVAPW